MNPAARRSVLYGLALAAILTGAPPGPPTRAAEECLVCHEDASLTTERRGRTVALYVDPAVLAESTHRDLECLDCHVDLNPEELPHATRIAPVECTGCHGDTAETHLFHAPPEGGGSGAAYDLACTDCHGTHDIAAPTAPGSRFHAMRQVESCGACHSEIAEHFQRSEHGQALAADAPGAPACLSCHERPLTPARGNGDGARTKIAQEQICLSCHLNDPEVRARMAPGAGFIEAYEQSVHGAALLRGNAAAANCVDCHGSHDMLHGFDPNARVNKPNIPTMCGGCHTQIGQQYERSIHWSAVARGNSDAPVCTDCHGEHDILDHTNPKSPIAPANVSAQVCSPCHSSLRLSSKYGIASDRFKTFEDSFHGLAIRGGELEVANCASCHGAHDILPADDPQSSVNKANLQATCGQCHPGANRRFAQGAVHVVLTEPGEQLLYWIARCYVVLIVVVIGGMLVHNGLDFIRKSKRRIRLRYGALDRHEEPAGNGLYLRMTLSERVQHVTLMLSFIALVVTGFMLHYSDAWWVQAMRHLSDHLFDLRSLLHRIAGGVMVAASFYHIYYLALTKRGRGFLRDMLPRGTDLTDALGVLMHNLGLTPDKPRFGRFSYIEKSEYWALVWGTIVMAVTGVVLWFEDTFIGMLTKLGWDAARTIHFYEAWLATLAILVWHLYYVIFNPDVYPMNMAWLTGQIPEEEMLEEHPLELEAIRRQGLMEPGEPPVRGSTNTS